MDLACLESKLSGNSANTLGVNSLSQSAERANGERRVKHTNDHLVIEDVFLGPRFPCDPPEAVTAARSDPAQKKDCPFGPLETIADRTVPLQGRNDK